jgi:phospholipid/cholesterol/gamma-HCH transport system permease protein
MAKGAGQWLVDAIELFGRLVNETLAAGQWLLKGRINFKGLLHQLSFVGWDALWMALILVIFSGIVIALQVAEEMVKQGGVNYVGALISMAILREMGPVMTAVALIAVVGTTHSSELTTMNNTEQTDALSMMHISPSRYLILPRLLGCLMMTPLLTTVTSISAIYVAMWVCQYQADVQPGVFLQSVKQFSDMTDFLNLVIKGVSFGGIIAIVSSTIGRHSKGGAKEVGIATTKAVVTSFVLVALADFAITYFIYGASN